MAGSGKTFTMIGDAERPGVVPRAMDHVWDMVEASVGTEWHLSLTYVELYNDAFRDLLVAAPVRPEPRLRPLATAVRTGTPPPSPRAHAYQPRLITVAFSWGRWAARGRCRLSSRRAAASSRPSLCARRRPRAAARPSPT